MDKSIFDGMTIYGRKDGTFVVDGYHVCPKDIDPCGKYDIEELKAYLAEHPEALQDEPISPPPTDAELKARAEAQRQALFAEYDKKVLQYQREVRLGIAGAEEKLAAWDAYAEALRAINDVEGWFRDPQWPQKPEI